MFKWYTLVNADLIQAQLNDSTLASRVLVVLYLCACIVVRELWALAVVEIFLDFDSIPLEGDHKTQCEILVDVLTSRIYVFEYVRESRLSLINMLAGVFLQMLIWSQCLSALYRGAQEN